MNDISDDDLSRLLTEAASSYDVPEHGPTDVLAAVADQPVRPPMARRPWIQLSSAAAIVTAGALFFAVNDGNPTVASNSAPTSHTQLAERARRDALTRSAGSIKAAPDLAPAVGGAMLTSGSFGVAGSGSAAGGVGAVAVPAPAAALTAPQAPAALPRVGAPVNDEGESRVVKTGSIALVVGDGKVSSTLKAVESAARHDGGYIANGTTNEYGETPSGELTIRVPVAKFEDLVSQVRGLDAKVRTATTTGKDVTAQYSDLEAQLRSLKATRERFYLILTKTKTISEILTVQQRIDDVSGQIDRIEGQRKLLANQSDLATLSVSVSEAGDPIVKATTKPRSGISQAFENAKDGFVTGVEAIISHSGRALLWLLCIGVVALVLRSGWRVARRRMV
ncbi:MAG: hypothetical protein QOJ79_1522 [Actinomycetota bacterium]|jgi:hypothetical protein|nr:hypothetical protein [Actinomycetota bacterium]